MQRHTYCRDGYRLDIILEDDFEPIELPIKNKWLEELRSGKYIQEGKILSTVDKKRACCLGVLCFIEGVPLKILDDCLINQEGFHFYNGKEKLQESDILVCGQNAFFQKKSSILLDWLEVTTLADLNDRTTYQKDYFFVRCVIQHIYK